MRGPDMLYFMKKIDLLIQSKEQKKVQVQHKPKIS